MVICPYCNSEAKLVNGTVIYPHRTDLANFKFWYCDEGHEPAYVGCHRISVKHGFIGTEPLGRLANRELRMWKSKAHAAFDPLWKNGKITSRNKAYNWLSNVMNIPKEKCHIGMFDVEQCKEVVNVCNTKI